MSENRQQQAELARQIEDMVIDEEAAYRALQSRDARFDGAFFAGVRTTGIYCRPSCAARTPLRRNVDFYASAAGAQRAGFRACKRCRPDATPGSADWNARADLAGRAVRLIADGVVDRSGVSGLASRLGYSKRQITRTLQAEMGAPPVALARAQRAQTARILLERTSMQATDIAYAAGFSSVRQFNETIRQVFDTTPTQLRTRRPMSSESGEIELRLAFRPPMALGQTLRFLGDRTIAGLEEFNAIDGSYSRILPLPHGPGLVHLQDDRTLGGNYVRARIRLTDHRDLATAVTRTRRLLDLDADPQAVESVLSRHSPLATLIARRPGLRSPGAVDPFEMIVRAVVGQQVSVAGARTILSRLTAEHGAASFDLSPSGPVWRSFPTADTVAGLDPAQLPMPRARGRTLISVAEAVADQRLVLDAGADRTEVRETLLSIKGIGEWTADYLLMRAVGDPDVFLGTDLAIRHALTRLAGRGLAQEFSATGCAPWRSYLTHHLWASLADLESAEWPGVRREIS